MLRTVRKKRGSVLKDITFLYNNGRDVKVHARTVQRILHKNKVFRRVIRKRMRIREANRKKRLSWCLEHRRWTVNAHWNQIIFSHESQIVIGQNHCVFVWRSSAEAYHPECMYPPCQRKVSIMIWGCITWFGVGTIWKVDRNINAIKYKNILEDNLWPVLARHFVNKPYRFQDDNAPVHRARILEEYKRDNEIRYITWPAQSPDLNIIENVWHRMKRSLEIRAIHIGTTDEHFTAVQDIWTNLSLEYVRNLYSSLPNRIMSCIRNKGHLTKY